MTGVQTCALPILHRLPYFDLEKQIKVSADVERIPYKIATGEGFSGYTADQWKTFIMIYATPIMWDLLEEDDQQILTNFVKACFLLTTRIIDDSALDEAHSRLLTVARLVEDNYGPEMTFIFLSISLNAVGITVRCMHSGATHSKE